MRLFVAVDLKMPPVVSEIKEELNCNAKWVEPENFHITLKFYGESNPNLIIPLLKKMEGRGSFEVVLKGLGHFKNRVLWLGVDAPKLVELGKLFDENFTAHATIARLKERCELSPLLKKYAGEFSRQLVSTVKLKESILSSRGPIYKDKYEVKL